MTVSVRSCLTTVVATIAAATIAFVPSVREPAPSAPDVRVPTPAIQLAAQVRPPITGPVGIEPTAQVQSLVTTAALPDLLVEWVQRIFVPPSASAPFPTPQFPPVVAPTSIGSSIKGIYNAVEPWVEWGFDVAAYAVGWIPWVGWLAPQITIFYDFGEMIVRSITFNIADWLDNRVSFAQGLVNVGVDTINAFIFLANAQLAFWLPPLPPIPPIGTFAAAETAELTEPTESMAMMAAEIPGEAALVVETEDPGSTDKLGDVVESEEAAVEAEGVDAAVTEEETQQIETEGTEEEATLEGEEEATLEEEPAVEDEVAAEEDEESTTSSESGTVNAQGEVRDTGITALPDETADNDANTSSDDKTADETTGPTDAAPSPSDDDATATTMRRPPTTTPDRRSGSAHRIQVAPQHKGGGQRAQHNEQQRCVLHDAGPSEDDVVAGSAECQHRHRHQPGPQRQGRQPRCGRPLQRGPHERRVEQAAQQRADGKRHRPDAEREKEGGG